MPTKEVVSHFAASSPEAKGFGPLQGTTPNAPQSLIYKHECLAARPDWQTQCTGKYDDGRLGTDQDRVRSTGARTPGSLAAEIEGQKKMAAERRESKKMEDESKDDKN